MGLSHAIALAVGFAIAVAGTGPAHGVRVGYPAGEQVCPSLPPGQAPVVGPPSGSSAPENERPSWVARPASDAQILSGTDVDLPILTPVQAGDSLVVSIMLTATDRH